MQWKTQRPSFQTRQTMGTDARGWLLISTCTQWYMSCTYSHTHTHTHTHTYIHTHTHTHTYTHTYTHTHIHTHTHTHTYTHIPFTLNCKHGDLYDLCMLGACLNTTHNKHPLMFFKTIPLKFCLILSRKLVIYFIITRKHVWNPLVSDSWGVTWCRAACEVSLPFISLWVVTFTVLRLVLANSLWKYPREVFDYY